MGAKMVHGGKNETLHGIDNGDTGTPTHELEIHGTDPQNA